MSWNVCGETSSNIGFRKAGGIKVSVISISECIVGSDSSMDSPVGSLLCKQCLIGDAGKYFLMIKIVKGEGF